MTTILTHEHGPENNCQACYCSEPGQFSPARPTVTGKPGSPPVILEDDSLPHQIRIMYSPYSGITVSCTCLRKPGGNGRRRAGIGTRTGTFPAREAIAAYRQWHADHEGMVQP